MNDGLDALRDNNKALVLQAADALAKAVKDLEGVEIGTSHWWAVEKNLHDALAAYEKARGKCVMGKL